MAEEKSPAGEIASGMSSIFERIGEFFHIFDLSFFVAGATTFGALAFCYIKLDFPSVFPFAPWVGVLAIIIACYVCGLVSFAIGREISSITFRRHTLLRTLPIALKAHNLTGELINLYTANEESRLWWLYARMWSEVASDESKPAILHHLMRYWAMAATYDGVAFSFIVWAGTLSLLQFRFITSVPLDHAIGIPGMLLCVCAAVFSFRRGADYYEYQIGDIVAHFAVEQCRLVP